MSVFLRLFWLSRFRLFLSDGSSKTLQKKLYKKIGKKYKTDFFSWFYIFIPFLCVFDEGVKKYRKNKSDPGPFLASYPPTHHGKYRNISCRPVSKCPLQAEKIWRVWVCLGGLNRHIWWSCDIRPSWTSLIKG